MSQIESFYLGEQKTKLFTIHSGTSFDVDRYEISGSSLEEEASLRIPDSFTISGINYRLRKVQCIDVFEDRVYFGASHNHGNSIFELTLTNNKIVEIARDQALDIAVDASNIFYRRYNESKIYRLTKSDDVWTGSEFLDTGNQGYIRGVGIGTHTANSTTNNLLYYQDAKTTPGVKPSTTFTITGKKRPSVTFVMYLKASAEDSDVAVPLTLEGLDPGEYNASISLQVYQYAGRNSASASAANFFTNNLNFRGNRVALVLYAQTGITLSAIKTLVNNAFAAGNPGNNIPANQPLVLTSDSTYDNYIYTYGFNSNDRPVIKAAPASIPQFYADTEREFEDYPEDEYSIDDGTDTKNIPLTLQYETEGPIPTGPNNTVQFKRARANTNTRTITTDRATNARVELTLGLAGNKLSTIATKIAADTGYTLAVPSDDGEYIWGDELKPRLSFRVRASVSVEDILEGGEHDTAWVNEDTLYMATHITGEVAAYNTFIQKTYTDMWAAPSPAIADADLNNITIKPFGTASTAITSVISGMTVHDIGSTTHVYVGDSKGRVIRLTVNRGASRDLDRFYAIKDGTNPAVIIEPATGEWDYSHVAVDRNTNTIHVNGTELRIVDPLEQGELTSGTPTITIYDGHDNGAPLLFKCDQHHAHRDMHVKIKSGILHYVVTGDTGKVPKFYLEVFNFGG